ncbi:unnamed protein product [Prorocentrum cordatum]|uniref:Uncharacterized protein n=1 Tax=Prorocentrum cordatum TaxID=2364126 RepID=A0ABN9U0Q4_9DINO|nr:unnamed protein product [Polarella glacialis]
MSFCVPSPSPLDPLGALRAGRCAGGWSVVERPGTDRPRGCPRRLWLSLAVGAWCLCCRDPELEAVRGRGRERRGYACASSAQRRQCGAAVREQGGIRTACLVTPWGTSGPSHGAVSEDDIACGCHLAPARPPQR